MTLTDVAQTYLDLKDRKSDPTGSFDSRGRFRLAARAACCAAIRPPSVRWPYSEMVHGRTLVHVAAVHGADVAELRKAVRRLRPPAGPTAHDVFKVVAAVGGDRYLSLYDGETAYRLGVALVQPAKPDHAGGYYVYPTAAQAAAADVSPVRALADAPRVILRCAAAGRRVVYDRGKRAVSALTPLRVEAGPGTAWELRDAIR